jgi:hypothetical protein
MNSRVVVRVDVNGWRLFALWLWLWLWLLLLLLLSLDKDGT